MRRSIVTLAALLCAAAPASATTWQFSGFPSESDGAGTMLDSSITFGDNGLDWDASFAPNAEGRTPEAFWAVFTAGPRPRQAAEDAGLAILYGDKTSGTAWAYEYDPDSSRSSWRDPGNLIGSFGSVSFSDPDALGHVYFDLDLAPADVASINDPTLRPLVPPWQGLDFDTANGRLGVSSQFFANDAGAVYSTGPDGKISDFDFDGETSYGRHYRTAQPIPEPHAIAAFTLGLAVVGWGVARSRRSPGPSGSGS
jgi:YD repeat-containing protein